jgi:hypothetical protein
LARRDLITNPEAIIVHAKMPNNKASHPLVLMEKAVASIKATDMTAKKRERDLLITSPPIMQQIMLCLHDDLLSYQT